jgi:hypothetical protein
MAVVASRAFVALIGRSAPKPRDALLFTPTGSEVVDVSIELSFPFRLRDRLKAELALSLSRKRTAVLFTVLPAIGVLWLVLVFVGYAPAVVEEWWFVAAILATLPVGALLGVATVYLLNPSRDVPFRYRIDDEGVHVISETQSFTHKWPAILEARAGFGFFMLFFRPGCAHCLPMRALEYSGSLPRLIEILRAQGKRLR